MSALSGWHRGEQLVRHKLGLDQDHSTTMLYSYIDGDLPPDHAQFHSRYLPFLPVVTLDKSGRPWGSILAGRDGKPGFITHNKYSTLTIDAFLWEGEPLRENLMDLSVEEDKLIAGIGIDFSNRRRNKFAGQAFNVSLVKDVVHIDCIVTEAIGNCPKYINIRELEPHPHTSPKVIHKDRTLSQSSRLPDPLINMITSSDTVFIGTVYKAFDSEAALFPSHVGMNQRGGLSGFIRVVPSDGRTIVLPDFSGNQFMTSLGNIEATPFASLTFIDFETGDILYITGNAKNFFGSEAQAIMPLQNSLTTIHVTAFTFIRDALPLRQRPGTTPQRSPYSPPIRLLAEETPHSTMFSEKMKPTATLVKIDIHSPTIATFTWEVSEDLDIKPGQAIIMDFTGFLGAKKYQHMSPLRPSAVNDDRIRTWTVSSANSSGRFSLTMREKQGGIVTGVLFTIARKLSQFKPQVLEDSRVLDLNVKVVGVTGDFLLPEPPIVADSRDSDASKDMENSILWIAGGIGITPFLSMLTSLVCSPKPGDWKITFVLSTREPEVLLPLVVAAMGEGKGKVHLNLHVFSNVDIPDASIPGDSSLHKHTGHISSSFFDTYISNIDQHDIYICGPEIFSRTISADLISAGVLQKKLHREGFEY